METIVKKDINLLERVADACIINYEVPD